MPLERSDAILDLSDPNLVLGPRKRRATERVLKNGDPLAKKKQNDNMSPGNTGTIVSNASVDKGKHTPSLIPVPAQLTHAILHAKGATNNTKGSGTRTSGGAQAIIVEDGNNGATTDKDDDAELGMFSITLVYIC